MILIFSEEVDQSTNFVVEWLHYQKKKFIRVNNEDSIKIEDISLKNGKITFTFIKNKSIKIKSNEISSVWFRRGNLNFDFFQKEISNNRLYNHVLIQNLRIEAKGLNDFVFKSLEEISHLGDINYETNKLRNLIMAQKVGLKTPKTNIISSKKNLEKKVFENELINKSIQKGILIKLENDTLLNYTSLITKNIIDDLPSHFSPSLVQEKIKKKFEIRVFVINDEIFSMAIFSQNNKQTEIDFRKYDHTKPNRRVPFDLPKNIEKKIIKFMNLTNLTTGSIDMVVNDVDEFIFLEINPVGQFDMVTSPCNYFLYKKIASNLI